MTEVDAPEERDLLAHADAAVVATDCAGRVTFWNRGAAAVLGRAADEAIGRDLRELVRDDGRETEAATALALAAAGASWSGEIRVRRPDGSRAVLAATVSPVRAANGEVVGTIGVANDLTVVRSGEEAIRRRHELYRLVLENVHDLIALVDSGGRLLYASPSHLPVLGWPPDELIGAAALENVHPDDLSIASARFRDASEHGVPALERVRARRRDGGWAPLECRLEALRDDERGETLVLVVSRDLSETQRAESEAQVSHGLVDAVLGAVGDGVTVVDTAGGIVYANDVAARLLGSPGDAALERFELLADDGAPLPAAELPTRRVLAGAPAAEAVVRWRERSGGGERASFVRALPVHGPGGELLYAITVFHDVTEQRRAERRLRLLAEASTLLVASLDLEATLGALVPLVVPTLAEALAVELAEEGPLVAPEREPTSKPTSLPLTAGGRPLGTLTLWGVADLGLAHELARRVAAAAENARLHRETRRTAALLDTLFGTAPVGLAFLDREQRFVRVNTALAELNGLPPEQHLGRRPDELIPTLDPAISARFDRVLETRRPLLDQEESGETPARPGERRHFRVSYYPIEDAAGEVVGAGVVVIDTTAEKRVEAERAELLEREQVARAEAERAAQTLLRLEQITDVALEHLSIEDLLNALLARLVELLDGDTAAILLLDEQAGGLAVRATIGLEREVVEAATIPVGRGLAGRVAAERAAVVVHDLDEVELYSPHLRAAGVRSLVAAPLVAEGRVFGVFHVDSARPGKFGPEDAHLLELASDRIALAITQSSLHEAERRAQERLALLADASAVLGSSLDDEAALASLARLAVPRAADVCAIHIRREDGSIATVSIVDGDAERSARFAAAARERTLDPDAAAGVPAVIRSGRSQLLPEVTHELVDEVAAVRPGPEEELQALVGASALLVPLAARGRILGAITLVRDAARERYDASDLAFAEELAGRAATAVDNARLYRQAEEQAHAARILENVGDGVFLLDREGCVRYWNRAAETISGLAAGEVLERRLRDLVPGWPSIEELVPVGTAGVSAPLQVGSRELWLSISGVALEEGTVYAFRDLTEERAIEELRTEFVSTVSHELRTPLAAIYGAAMTLRREDVELSDVQRANLLGVVAGEADRLARIVNDILWASRLDSGGLTVLIESCDPVELAGLVVAAQQAHLSEGIVLRLTAEERLPQVAADPDKVRQVLVNLVDNAVKYSPGGGAVQVRVYARGGHVRFAVADEGLGIPYAEQRRIFDKFYRLDPDLTRGVGGTGLGLYISRELVRRMHGRIWVDSTPGGGSTFTVELPVAG